MTTTMQPDLRAAVIDRWLGQLGQPCLEPPTLASSDASTRRYWRVRIQDGSRIVMDESVIKSIPPFVDVQQRLARVGVPVPYIEAVDVESGLVLLEDLGDDTLYHWMPRQDAQAVADRLIQAVDLLPNIANTANAGLPAFDADRLQTEMELLPEWYLDRLLEKPLSTEERARWENACRAITERLTGMPQVFVHRDYHSRNLMVQQDRLITIDFQDAVTGPLPYDLVSLLRDSYVDWPEAQVAAMQQRFHQQTQEHGLYADNVASFREDFAWVAVQRHLKVLGIFARLSIRDGKHRYLNDLPLTWRHLHKSLDQIPALADLSALLSDRTPDNRPGKELA